MKFLRQLLDPASYDHPVEELALLETHISWVILTGEYAYKVKKPVNLGFLDFSSLEKRFFYCNQEIRLNKRLAPQIYLETVAITGNEIQLQINGAGPVLEYAVKMRQFRQQDQFDRLLENDNLYRRDIQDLAVLIAHFHLTTPAVGRDSDYGDPAHIRMPVEENFNQINDLLKNEGFRKTLTTVLTWTQNELKQLQPVFMERKKRGFVRECHGDMHLRNIAKYQNDIVVFDCIEFNDNLRWIDVVSEIAFIEMDLYDRGRVDYANILLNTYLQTSGDYASMRLLRFYLVYRAMVRAKVACIRAHQEDIQPLERTENLKEFAHYLNLAERFTQPEPAALLITCGLSGCGKTHITDQLMDYLPFIRLRSDVERKRLHGLTQDQNSHSSIGKGIYTGQDTSKTYQRLAELSRCVLTSQWNVVVDATFLRAEQRQQFRALAANLGVPFLILHFKAPEKVLLNRVTQRQLAKSDSSEADSKVLEYQISCYEPLGEGEKPHTIDIDTAGDVDIPLLAQRIRLFLSHQRLVKQP